MIHKYETDEIEFSYNDETGMLEFPVFVPNSDNEEEGTEFIIYLEPNEIGEMFRFVMDILKRGAISESKRAD